LMCFVAADLFQKCTYCVKKKYQKRCYPTWYPSRKIVEFRCPVCVLQHQRCSFKDMNFGIVKMPQVTKSKAGDDRRGRDRLYKRGLKAPAKPVGKVAQKQKKVTTRATKTRVKKQTAPGPAPKDPLPSLSVSTRARSAAAAAAAAATAMGPSPAALPTAGSQLQAVTPPIQGDGLPEVGVTPEPAAFPTALTDLCMFEDIVRDENRSRVFLEQERTKLIATMITEREAANQYVNIVKQRRSIARGLVDVFNRRIIRRGGKPFWISDSEEELESVPASDQQDDDSTDSGADKMEGGSGLRPEEKEDLGEKGADGEAK
jgi:hypothetical protein